MKPNITVGFYFSIGLEAKIHKQILDTDAIKYIVGEKEDDDEENDTKLTLKLVGKAEATLSVSVGIILGESPFKMSILAGIEGLLGSGEIGFSLTINFNNGNIIIDKFYIYKAFYISLFLMIEIEIETSIIDFKFKIYIFNVPLFGIKIEMHSIFEKILGKMINNYFIKDYILKNKYQLAW